MSPLARQAFRVAVGYAALVGVVTLAALPVSYSLTPASRVTLLHVAAGVVLAVALAQVARAARRRVEAQAPSAFDRALVRVEAEPTLPREFRELFDEVRFGRARDGYFQRILWPRLVSLAASRPDAPVLVAPARSRVRRWLGLGPPLSAIRGIIARMEDGREDR